MAQYLSHYDVVILGEHPAGLYAGKLAIEQGKRVLIVLMGGATRNQVLPRKIAEQFGLEDLLSESRQPIQILTPESRFRVGKTLDEINAEYEFHFGHGLEAFEAPRVELLRGMVFLSRGSETGPALPEKWGVLAARVADTVYFEKSEDVLMDRMLGKLKDLGADTSSRKSLRRVFVDGKRLLGVQLAERAEVISAETVFIATNLDQIKPYLNESLRENSEPISWNFEIKFECSVDALPIGLSERMIYVEAEAPILEILYDHRGHFLLRTAVPFQEKSLDRGFQRRIAERMLKVCERFIPDLEYNLKKVIPDVRDPERVETVELPELYPFQDLHRIPPKLLNYGIQSALGFQLALQNCFITNEETDPRLGLWGAFIGVDEAYALLAKRNKKNQKEPGKAATI